VAYPIPVTVTNAYGTSTSNVQLARYAPSFSLLDSMHVAGIILRSNGSGAYGGGTYDILGPTGSSLGYATVAAKAGDTVELFAVGLGPTNPPVPAGQAFSGAAPTTYPVSLLTGPPKCSGAPPRENGFHTETGTGTRWKKMPDWVPRIIATFR
jgi:uncharacterized protein (TIGR03437 family)